MLRRLLILLISLNVVLSACTEKTSQEQTGINPELDALVKSIQTSLKYEVDEESKEKVVGSFSVHSDKGTTEISNSRLMDPTKDDVPIVLKHPVPDDECRNQGGVAMQLVGDIKQITLTRGSYAVALVSKEGLKQPLLSINPAGGTESTYSNELFLDEEKKPYSLQISPANLSFSISAPGDKPAGSVSPTSTSVTSVSKETGTSTNPETFALSFNEQTLFNFDALPSIAWKNIPSRIKDLPDLEWVPDTEHHYKMVTVSITVSDLKDKETGFKPTFDSKKKGYRSNYSVDCHLSADTGNLKGIKNLDVMKRIAEISDGIYNRFSIRIKRELPIQKETFSYQLNNEAKKGYMLLYQNTTTRQPESSDSSSEKPKPVPASGKEMGGGDTAPE